jgi:ribosome-binding factor A
MADPRRIQRIQSRLQQDIAELFLTELKDPRMKGLISITRVEVSKDLSYAKVYWSLLGSEGDRRTTERFLQDAKGLIRKRVGKGLDIRTFPELHFIYDDAIEKQMEVSKLIDQALEADKKGQEGDSSDE